MDPEIVMWVGGSCGTAAASAIGLMWRTMNKQSADRHKASDKRFVRVEEKLDECVFAKGELERQFASDRNAHNIVIQSMIEENYWNKKRKRDRRTGG